mmetsp:Transcript_63759/g.100845  ORF Transcript_63759/g.100845 Transcript_63759/m.100845 type:complete len:91 (-) Transcript_63759:68-340(-)
MRNRNSKLNFTMLLKPQRLVDSFSRQRTRVLSLGNHSSRKFMEPASLTSLRLSGDRAFKCACVSASVFGSDCLVVIVRVSSLCLMNHRRF